MPAQHELAHIRRAAERWYEGDAALAAVHLALSGLHQLQSPEDAKRLLLADGLLSTGLEPDTLVKALDLKTAKEEPFQKYDPDQPRVPAGNGRTNGEWTTGEGAPASPPTPTAATRAAPRPRQREQIPKRAPLANRQPASNFQPSPRTPVSAARPRAAGSTGDSTSNALGPAHFSIELPLAMVSAALPSPVGPFGRAVRALGDSIEVADSIEKWRELGPKGEELVEAV